MGRHEKLLDKELTEAREAWDRGDAAVVVRARSSQWLESDRLSRVLCEALDMGWELADSSVSMITFLTNEEAATFVFVRPK